MRKLATSANYRHVLLEPHTAQLPVLAQHSSTSASRTPAHIPSLRHKRDDASRVTLHCSQATLVFQSRNNRRSPQLANMKAAALLSLVASAAVGLAAADGLKIDVTLPVDCDRKTKNGDRVSMHYKGTLAESGNKFDASM